MVIMKTITKNCAIYTRKSTDEGLDQDFNSLHAQRESCEAYVASQRAEGWKLVKTDYSDAGLSGGTLERPALQQLLTDIRDGKVQIIVCYKIDRLSRSLMDFAKLIDVFDQYGVTFVSITQNFSTVTSMGRLTLNVLLSFAQFERELSAERIRDKIAASKKKGLWMGGNPPIGYEVQDRKLLIKPDDAKTARMIFERYLELGSVAALKKELDERGITSPVRTSKRGHKVGGSAFSRGALYSTLGNPIYIGKIRHKDQIYDGLHEALIDQELWGRVQKKLSDQAVTHKEHKKARDVNLLKGLLYDPDGKSYSPSHTKKGGKRYRYYISQTLLQYGDHPKGAMARLPAHEIEQVVTDTVRNGLNEILALDAIEDHDLIAHIKPSALPDAMLIESINRITVMQGELLLEINPETLRQNIQIHIDLHIPSRFEVPTCILSVPFSTRRTYKGAVILKPDKPDHDPFDLPPYQLRNLIRGVIWRDEHFSGTTIKDIAARENLSESGIRKIIMASFDILQTA